MNATAASPAREIAREIDSPSVATPALRLKLTEIFLSIQGEADSVGWPTVFVRLTGCPLRCQYCDTQHAFHGGGGVFPSAVGGAGPGLRVKARLISGRRAAGAEALCRAAERVV